MRKRFIPMFILICAAAGYMALGGTAGFGKEAPGYEEEAPGYQEEAGGYADEAAGYGDEAAGYGDEAEPAGPAVPIEAGPIAVMPNKPSSIDELIMWYDSSSCQECHEEIYAQWENSAHARPLMGVGDLVFLGPVIRRGHLAVKNPKDATGRNFPCFKCHLPQAMNLPDPVYAQIARAVFANDKETLRKLNISCLVCHNEMAITHSLFYGRPETGVLYGAQDLEDHEDENYPVIKKSAIMNRSVMCGQCHGLGPNMEFENPVQCATLFGSYLHNYIPAGGLKTCQDCHMENGDHSVLPNFNDKEGTSARLAQSIELNVETLGYQFLGPKKQYAPVAAVKTRVISSAGHRIPDG